MKQYPPGTRFGSLVVIGPAPGHRLPSGEIQRRLSLQCDCGNKTYARVANLMDKRSPTRSCRKCYVSHRKGPKSKSRRLQELESENKRLRDALAWYSDRSRSINDLMCDAGVKARAALGQ